MVIVVRVALAIAPSTTQRASCQQASKGRFLSSCEEVEEPRSCFFRFFPRSLHVWCVYQVCSSICSMGECLLSTAPYVQWGACLLSTWGESRRLRLIAGLLNNIINTLKTPVRALFCQFILTVMQRQRYALSRSFLGVHIEGRMDT